MAGNVAEVSDQNFDMSVLKSDKPVLVDFWAPWCGPCRAVAPVVAEMAGEYDGRVGFAKLNTDDNQRVAMQFGVMSIPTLIMFQNGAEVGRLVGARPKADFKKLIDGVVGAVA